MDTLPLMIDVLDTCCALKSLIVLVSHAGHIWTLLLNAQRLFLIFLWKNKVSTCPR